MPLRRTVALYCAVLACFMAVVCRLYLLAQNQAYAGRASRQSTVTLTLAQKRGNFYDCEGLPLTGLQSEWYALCVPGQGSYARLFASALPQAQVQLYQNRNASRPFLVQVRQDLTAQGVFTVVQPRRYCTIPLCQHLIGYLDGEGRGVAGLEKAFDRLLVQDAGQDAILCTANAQGGLWQGSAPVYTQGAGAAMGVQLTIHRALQRAAEAVAAQTMATGCILVLETATARVRACVSVPGFDPAQVEQSLGSAQGALLNRAFCAYAVGSVFKPVLAAAALEQGVQLQYDCPGYLQLEGHAYRCAGGVAHGPQGLQQALAGSCNGYFIRLGQQLGPEVVRRYAQQFGFGQAVHLAGSLKAAAGTLPASRSLADAGQFANLCFGQGGLTATPLQVAGMINTIAAGGVWRTPCFLQALVDEASGQPLRQLWQPAQRRVMSEAGAAALCGLLCGVVEQGTGAQAAPPHLAAAGKTGTAQTGRYTPQGEEYANLWFAGFYPAQQPQYTVVVMQDSQLQAQYSSARIFAQLCEAIYQLGLVQSAVPAGEAGGA